MRALLRAGCSNRQQQGRVACVGAGQRGREATKLELLEAASGSGI